MATAGQPERLAFPDSSLAQKPVARDVALPMVATWHMDSVGLEIRNLHFSVMGRTIAPIKFAACPSYGVKT